MQTPRDYKAQLEKVSRSFAFCIAELKEDLQSHVALAYLLFRVLDTIEDSEWKSKDQQRECFRVFLNLLETDLSLHPQFLRLFDDAKMKEAEEILLKESHSLFEDFQNLNEATRRPLLYSLKTMTQGMEFYAIEKRHETQNLPELNLYCYFVAGCIGELLTAWTFPSSDLRPQLFENSVHFGLFLQKINILKDFLDDERAGRNFLWSWREVAASLRPHAEKAFEYIQQIPRERSDYKIFCSWSLFLGLLSYPHIEESLETKKQKKVSRLQTWQLLNSLKRDILLQRNLTPTFDKLLAALPSKQEDQKAFISTLSAQLLPPSEVERLKIFDFA